MAQITYTDKVALNENNNVADINKVKAEDMNEIKSVVNGIDSTVQVMTNANVYSTTEKNTGKTWVNGKTIYRKVLTGTTTTTDTAVNIAHGISNYEYIMIDNKSFVKSTGSGNVFIFPINCPPNTSTTYDKRPIRAYVTNNNISLYIGAYNGYSSYEYAIILEYTKSS
ncbi:MAG: hypothetical protein J6W64_09165 [Bacilli bacterium]|nr:hypothetical protein [Bacilli bacterium]MBO7712729.1 hypothetical protein [Methanobrevibacter sp.]MBO7712787.1 hypothetical protein [Methanobrevibacter sp.]